MAPVCVELFGCPEPLLVDERDADLVGALAAEQDIIRLPAGLLPAAGKGQEPDIAAFGLNDIKQSGLQAAWLQALGFQIQQEWIARVFIELDKMPLVEHIHHLVAIG